MYKRQHMEINSALLGHLVGMTQQPEAGDVGHGVGRGGRCGLGGGAVELFHACLLYTSMVCNILITSLAYVVQ